MTTLYLPVETASRELDAKLLLALFCVDQGMEVVLGNRALMANTLHKFRPGIFLSHNFDKGRRRILSIAHKLGHRVVAWDEEGLIWHNRESYLSRRVDPAALDQVERIYAWGHDHEDALAAAVMGKKITIMRTGNPRTDLLRPQLRALYEARTQELGQQFGDDFILINSNFGWLNHALVKKKDPTDRTEGELTALSQKSRMPLGHVRHRYVIFRAFCDLLPELSRRYADRKIVIRPHPSEDPGSWRAAAAGLDNVVVTYDRDLVPWLLAAGTILHNGCTTAIESALLGRIPIMYRPVDGGVYEMPQPMQVSAEAVTRDDLFDLMDNADRLEAKRDIVRGNLATLIEDWDGAFSAARVAADLARLDIPSQPSLARLEGQALSRIRALEKKAKRYDRSSPSHPAYIDQKFPPTQPRVIAGRIAALAGLVNMTAPHVRGISDRIYSIGGKSSA